MISTCIFLVFTLAAGTLAVPRTQIVEGDPALLCEMPSIAFLKIYKTYEMGYKVCGGTLVSPSYIVTAAHCLEGLIDYVTVNLGSTNKLQDGPQTIKAYKVILHSNYSRSIYTIKNDIALLKLETPVKNTDCVKPVAMATKTDVFDHETCIIAGWGRTGLKKASSDVLLKAFVPIIPTKECKNQSSLNISTGSICAGDFVPGGVSICKGDSGGPLYCPHDSGMVIAGVTSYGVDCHNEMSVFTSIAYYRDWLDQNMN